MPAGSGGVSGQEPQASGRCSEAAAVGQVGRRSPRHARCVIVVTVMAYDTEAEVMLEDATA